MARKGMKTIHRLYHMIYNLYGCLFSPVHACCLLLKKCTLWSVPHQTFGILFFKFLYFLFNLLINLFGNILAISYIAYDKHYFEISIVPCNLFPNSISGGEFHAWESNKLNNKYRRQHCWNSCHNNCQMISLLGWHGLLLPRNWPDLRRMYLWWCI